jgi:hypothetical protein
MVSTFYGTDGGAQAQNSKHSHADLKSSAEHAAKPVDNERAREILAAMADVPADPLYGTPQKSPRPHGEKDCIRKGLRSHQAGFTACAADRFETVRLTSTSGAWLRPRS